MSELTIEQRVAVAAVEPDDDSLVHVFCCNPDIAACGENLSGRPVLPDDTETTCRICAIAWEEELPCGDPDCPYREGRRAES